MLLYVGHQQSVHHRPLRSYDLLWKSVLDMCRVLSRVVQEQRPVCRRLLNCSRVQGVPRRALRCQLCSQSVDDPCEVWLFSILSWTRDAVEANGCWDAQNANEEARLPSIC